MLLEWKTVETVWETCCIHCRGLKPPAMDSDWFSNRLSGFHHLLITTVDRCPVTDELPCLTLIQAAFNISALFVLLRYQTAAGNTLHVVCFSPL